MDMRTGGVKVAAKILWLTTKAPDAVKSGKVKVTVPMSNIVQLLFGLQQAPFRFPDDTARR